MKTQFLPFRKQLTLILTICCSIALISCSKDDDDSSGGNYSITFKADGVLKEFSAQQVEEGYYIDEAPLYRLTFNAESETASIYITLFDVEPLAEINYDGYSVNQTSTNVTITGPQFSMLHNGMYYNSITSEDHDDVALEMIEITSNTMRGRFSGIVKTNGGPDVMITEGEFTVPYRVSED